MCTHKNLIAEGLVFSFLVTEERLPEEWSLFDLGCLLNIKSAIYIFADLFRKHLPKYELGI